MKLANVSCFAGAIASILQTPNGLNTPSSIRIRPRTAKSAALDFQILEPRQMLAAATSWTVTSPGGGGALFAPAINPHNASEMFIYSDMSQVFRTRDAGASWNTLDFTDLGGSSGRQMQFTRDANIIYAIDYASIEGNDAAIPVRSNDGGNTWLALTDPTNRETFYLFADYDNPNRVIVSDWRNFFISSDGGQTWSQKYTADNDRGLHLAGAFFDGLKVVVGTNYGLLGSNDGGASFKMNGLPGIPANENIVTLTGAKENGVTRLYAVTQNAQVWGGYSTEEWYNFANVYRMDVGQTNWTSINSNLPANARPFFVDMAANDIDTIYVAGNDEDGLPLIYKSTNSGQNWNDVFHWKDNQNIATGYQGEGGPLYWWWGGGALGFDVDRSDADIVLVTDYGFAHLTDNGGTTWRNVNVNPADLNPVGQLTSNTKSYRSSGLGNTTIYNLTWLNQDTVLAGFADIEAAISHDGGKSWSFDFTGLDQNTLYRAQVHPTTNVVYAVTSTVHDLYQSTRTSDRILDAGSGKIVFSSDHGSTWQTLHDFGHTMRWLELDPKNPNRMYASVVHSTDGGIYVSDNINLGANSTWRKLANPPRTEGHPSNIQILNDGSLVVTYSARKPGDNGPFTASSGVFISSNGGQTWVDRTDARMKYWTQDITIDPHDPSQNTWYAGVYSGWGGPSNDLGGLYLTTDRGQTWNLLYQAHRVTAATLSPTNNNELYLTTETDGLIFTGNLHDANPTFARVEGVPFRQPLNVVFNPYKNSEVWVTTFGGQIWIGSTAETRVGGTFSLNDKRLLLDNDSQQQSVTISQSVTDYQFTLAAGSWSGVATAGINGVGTSRLSVEKTLLNTRVNGLQLRDQLNNDYDVFFSGTVDFTALDGVVRMDSVGDVRQRPGSVVKIDYASLNARDVVLTEMGNELSSLTVSGGFVNLNSQTDVIFGGVNRADSLTVASRGLVRNRVGSTLNVTRNLTVTAATLVDLARWSSDIFSVGGVARFNTGANPLLVGINGSANFGMLEVVSAGYVDIRENGSLHLAGLNSSRSAKLQAVGSITSTPTANIDTKFNLTLSSGERIFLGNSANNVIRVGGLARFESAISVQVRPAANVALTLVGFQSPYVDLSIDSRLQFFGSSTANVAILSSSSNIADAAGATVEIVNYTKLSAVGIYLADEVSNRLRFCKTAVFAASDFVMLNPAGFVGLGPYTATAGTPQLIRYDERC